MRIEKRMIERGIKQNQARLDKKYQLVSFNFLKDIVMTIV